MAHPYNGILLRNKKDVFTDSCNHWKDLECILLSERRQNQNATECVVSCNQFYLYDIMEKQKLQEWEQMSGCWGIGEEERLNIKQPHAGILG